MANVLLINPPFLGSKLHPCEPTGLLSLASCLRLAGHKVWFCDLSFETFSKAAQLIKDQRISIVGLGAITAQAEGAYAVAGYLKRRAPHVKIIYGGVHPTFLPLEPFAVGLADYVIRGEAEIALPAILSTTRTGSIKGVLDRQFCLDTSLADAPSALNSLPLPAYDLIEGRHYDNNIHVKPYATEQAVTLIFSRGCPYNCSFCSTPRLQGHRVRWRSVSSVIEELRILRQKYGFRYIHFQDNNFFLKPEFVAELCECILSEALDLKWVALTRIAPIISNKNLVELMSRSGCVGMEVGFQNSSKIVNKCANREDLDDLEHIKEAVKILQSNDIEPMLFQMSFCIGETLDSIYDSSQVVEGLFVDKPSRIGEETCAAVDRPFAFGQFLTPHVGTALFESSQKHGRVLARGWNDYTHGRVNYLPLSFLDDIPVRRHDFDVAPIFDHREIIEYYLSKRTKLGSLWQQQFRPYRLLNKLTGGWLRESIFASYVDFLREIYLLVNGVRTVREICELSAQAVAPTSLAIRWLAMFGMIRSGKGHNSAREVWQDQAAVDISIIIPTFNNCDIIGDAIDSVYAAVSELSNEIIVVDNGSTDGTAAFVKRYYSQVIVLEMNSNQGPTIAKNCGIKQSQGEFIFTMDSDVLIRRDSIKRMISIARAAPWVAAVSGAVTYIDDRSMNAELTYRTFVDLFRATWIAARFKAGRHPRQASLSKRRWAGEHWYYDTDVPYECAMLIRHSAIHDIGIFDENFRLYYSSHDWARRAKGAGWSVVQCDEIVNIHGKHGTLSPYSFLSRQQWEDGQRLVKKHLGTVCGLLNLCLHLLESIAFWLVFEVYYIIFRKSRSLLLINFARSRFKWASARLIGKHRAVPWGPPAKKILSGKWQ